jgi:phage/plasmid-associated DNA primase
MGGKSGAQFFAESSLGEKPCVSRGADGCDYPSNVTSLDAKRAQQQDIHALTHDRWFPILREVGGIDSDFLQDKHGPCPLCGGEDRWRWDDRDGDGGGFCNKCGGKQEAGGAISGFDLLMRSKGWEFKEAASEVKRFLGGEVADLRQTTKRGKPARIPEKPPFAADAPSPGKSVAQWCYTDINGDQLFWIQRYEDAGKPDKRGKPKKTMVHRTWLDGKWHFPKRTDAFTSEWPSPRPLLGQYELRRRPEAPVLVVEGETTFDAACLLFPTHVVITWSNGSKAVGHVDWSPLAGRKVTIWPDNDQDGEQCATKLVGILHGIGADSVSVVTPPAGVPVGWDLADAEEWDEAEADAHLDAHSSEPELQSSGGDGGDAGKTDPPMQEAAGGNSAPESKAQISAGPLAKAPKLPQSAVTEEDASELQLETKDSDWLPMVMKLAFGADLWLHIEGILHRWNGTHYEPLKDQALAPRVTPILNRLYYFNPKTNEDIHHWARPARITEAIEWFRKSLLPCTDYNPTDAINCQNGTLSWAWDGERMLLSFTPHDPAQRFTYCLPYSYEPEADGTHLWRLLDALEPQDRDTMQRLLGSGLQLERYRASRGRPRALLLLGDGENGKDTIRGALSLTLGARGMTGCTLSDFQQYDKGRKFPLSPLRGARINWSPENTSYARLEAIQSLKGAITGEELSWEQKNIQEQPFTPNAIFLFNCNQPPLMDAGQAAMQSRWHAVRFLKRYTSNPDPSDPNQLQADPRLKDDLDFIRVNICPAMLNWLLEGLQLAVRDGINFRSNPETIDKIRWQSCHLFEFAEEVGMVADPTAEIEHRKVWNLLEGWYQQQKILYLDTNGRPSWNDRDMGGDPPVRTPNGLERRLKAVFPKLTSRKAPKTRQTVLQGIALAKQLGEGEGI